MGLSQLRYVAWLVLGCALIGLGLYGYFGVAPRSTQPISLPPGLRLAFNDDFDAPTLDGGKWSTCFHFGEVVDGALRCILGETPAGVMEPDNVLIADGMARLVLAREKRAVFGKSFDLTFGMLSSHDRFSFMHGYVEIRAKVPPGAGTWPAFWLLPASKQWPPEIDIFEFLGREPNKIHGTLHMPDFNKKDVQRGGFASGTDYSQDFHRYAVRWTKSEMIWFVDDVEYFRVSDNLPAEPMYLIVSHGAGAPSSWGGALASDVVLPNYLEVDYVRVWTE
jgi:beta-glucanase (GH16 family)